jgi:peptidoglycan L-alanyl-D-glutamate endopeptidase CwlK
VDVVPYPVDWLDLARFRALAKVVKECAEELGTEVQWGGDWKTFVDMPHWELVD